MLALFLKILTDYYKPAGLIIVAIGFVWLGALLRGFSTDHFDTLFFSEAQAQTLEQKFDRRIADVEAKVDNLSSDFASSRRADIEREIFTLRVTSCMNTGTLRAVYEEQISKLIAEWRTVTRQYGASPPAPTCQDLGGR